jgi:hypothetical protein
MPPTRRHDKTLLDRRQHAAAETWKYVSAFFNPRSYYYVFALTDPMPFFADTWFVLQQALQGVARKLLRR